ncbi:MAG: NAD(P)/FAD-dependent oxidoreductase [Pyrinomonadaceae bacterium]|nr:NAD(P)/FAD-dependent oxidoreductase [Pyrinomonadaceae bacterium]MBP9109807.1 NAD(P)/FAD-dependent oxidoreductase [Pyrinomonadaceae bacterium]
MEHFDVLIIGAGLSGIGAGAHLRTECPEKTFGILEGRERSGGTWDLFRYPGVRSDSDMFTLGYSFRPWSDQKAIADGPSILNYIRETSAEYDLDKEIRYGHRVRRAEWSSETSKWTVEVGSQQETKQLTCNFIYLCTGYYEYDKGYTPDWPGFDDYQGTIIHPQKWPEDLDYTGKNVLVIGSGATAVTLVPAMADKAAHVKMLQRSPTYIVTMPSQDRFANFFRSLLPAKAAYAAARWKNIVRQAIFYAGSRKYPNAMKRLIAKGIRHELGDEQLERHFTPKYDPWDQRLCVVPDSDLFEAIREQKASIVTGNIETFTPTGVRLDNGEELNADIIVTATGLRLKIMAGLELVVDGETVDLSKKFAYKGMMYNDVPNLAQAFGYTNASWTLKCDLTSKYVCRLLKHMDSQGFASCTPRANDPTLERVPVLDFNSTYVLRVLDELPSQGSKHPWRLHQNYFKDLSMLRYAKLDDGVMEFRRTAIAEKSRENADPGIVGVS